MHSSNPSEQSQLATLYLLQINTLPLDTHLSKSEQLVLHRCLQTLQNALLAPSKSAATYYLKAAQRIAETLDIDDISSSFKISSNEIQGWSLENQGRHINIQALRTKHPLNCLVINLLTAYQVLLNSCSDSSYMTARIRDQSSGLHHCSQILSRVFHISSGGTQ